MNYKVGDTVVCISTACEPGHVDKSGGLFVLGRSYTISVINSERCVGVAELPIPPFAEFTELSCPHCGWPPGKWWHIESWRFRLDLAADYRARAALSVRLGEAW